MSLTCFKVMFSFLFQKREKEKKQERKEENLLRGEVMNGRIIVNKKNGVLSIDLLVLLGFLELVTEQYHMILPLLYLLLVSFLFLPYSDPLLCHLPLKTNPAGVAIKLPLFDLQLHEPPSQG